MNILLLAPHPFYQDRGTPIAVDLLLKTLSERGDNVDVLTYHEGADRTYSGPGKVTIHRIAHPPACRNIRPGFSIKKLIADGYMLARAGRMTRERTYDVVHAVEESVFMARRIKSKTGVPYIFDMDSSMPEQIVEKMPCFKIFLPLLRWFERRAIRQSLAVTAVCDSLAVLAKQGGSHHVAILRDVPLLDQRDDGNARGFRKELGISGPCLVYIGNLEKYQGIDLLLKSFAMVPAGLNAHLVIVGGTSGHVEHYKSIAGKLGLDNRTHILGPRPISDMTALMSEADILVSPRIKGTNTPMKIYSYMASGKAILATDLFTHTQVLDSTTARLAQPAPDEFSKAMQELLADPEARVKLGRQAEYIVKNQYSLDVFKRTLNDLYDWVSKNTVKP